MLDAVVKAVETKSIVHALDTAKLRAEHEAAVVQARTPFAFETAMNAMLRDLSLSHARFSHESSSRSAGRVAIAATYTKAQTPDGERWVFQDVHPGGAAHSACARPGDILLSVDGRELVPPEATSFRFGERHEIVIRRPDGTTAALSLAVPKRRCTRQRVVAPNHIVSTRRLSHNTGLLRVSMFPGVLGMDVARAMTRAVADLACKRLIVDLRGNSNGGIGCLRLMSLLCEDRRGVGYSLGRESIKEGRTKEQLPALDCIPASKWSVLPLFVRFAGAKRSIAVFSEALGRRSHHGRAAILVNEHSANAAEMVAAFASENGLATIVGVRTAGRVVAGTVLMVGHGYRFAVPLAVYRTWRDTNLETSGVAPDVVAPLNVLALRAGEDVQLSAALFAVSVLSQ